MLCWHEGPGASLAEQRENQQIVKATLQFFSGHEDTSSLGAIASSPRLQLRLRWMTSLSLPESLDQSGPNVSAPRSNSPNQGRPSSRASTSSLNRSPSPVTSCPPSPPLNPVIILVATKLRHQRTVGGAVEMLRQKQMFELKLTKSVATLQMAVHLSAEKMGGSQSPKAYGE
jgi:hypothetical protein